jgi:molybdopterin/thiamine biosynthesis adenylyltransferase
MSEHKSTLNEGTSVNLTSDGGADVSRYSRQILFPFIGKGGQQRLSDSKVAVVGMGALGTVLANHMVRAGVGFVRIIDRDFVEMSNLQRQMLYHEVHARNQTPKAIAAHEALSLINSSITIEPHVTDLNPTNAEELLSDVDLILDGTDNFAVRFLINDVAVKHNIPWVYGGAVSSRGVVLGIVPEQGPCLRCLFPQAPQVGTTETCDTAGVIGGIIHVIASYQATEGLKMLLGDEEHLNRHMLQLDLWLNHFSSVDVHRARRPSCPACGLHQYDYLERNQEEETISALCGRDTVQITPAAPLELNLDEWVDKLSPLGSVERNAFLLRFQWDQTHRLVLFPDGRAMVQGTDDPVYAKSIYAKYVGM